MPVFKEKGKLWIEPNSIRSEPILQQINKFGKKDLVVKYKIPKTMFQDLSDKCPIEYDLFRKLSNVLNMHFEEMLIDYQEELYDDLDIDLTIFKPTQADINETIKQCKIRMSTIKHYLDQSTINCEKKAKVFENIERLMLECQYLGVQLKAVKQEKNIISKIEKERNER